MPHFNDLRQISDYPDWGPDPVKFTVQKPNILHKKRVSLLNANFTEEKNVVKIFTYHTSRFTVIYVFHDF
jgi:hypothetical protein